MCTATIIKEIFHVTMKIFIENINIWTGKICKHIA